MKVVKGDMFELSTHGDAMCVTTNGVIAKGNKLVMGAGIAKEFRDRFSGMDSLLGKHVRKYGNRAFYLGTTTATEIHLLSFPTKHDWRDKSDLTLIEQSCIQLKQIVAKFNITGNIYIPAPGCGKGGLDWDSQVKPLVEKYFTEDRYIICFK